MVLCWRRSGRLPPVSVHLQSCDECKGSFTRGCEAKRWSHWTCSSLGTIFQPMRINSVPDVKCFCNNKNVLYIQSMVWHFVRHPVYVIKIVVFDCFILCKNLDNFSYFSVEITNKMQLCNRIYCSTVHWRLNMFRAGYRSSSGALTVFAASGSHKRVVTGRSQVWVETHLVIPVLGLLFTNEELQQVYFVASYRNEATPHNTDWPLTL